MGTRGFVGIVVDGAEKIAYNHFDSYPEHLGTNVLSWLWRNRHALTCDDVHRGETGGPVDLARKLRVVDPDSKPTAEDIERLRPYANLNVGQQTVDDWYVLLRETQGNLTAILTAGVIEDGSTFPTDSLFAEWGYLVDLDENRFEVYRGFQRGQHDRGRFADREPFVPEHRKGKPIEYYPCALVASWPLAELPTEEQFLKALGEDDE